MEPKFNIYEWGGVYLPNAVINIPTVFAQDVSNHQCDSVLFREPVIYVKNLTGNDFRLQVDIMPFGKITESVPPYKNFGDWNVAVGPGGVINDYYKYLFYEVAVKLTEPLNDLIIKAHSFSCQAEMWKHIRSILYASGFDENMFLDFVAYWARVLPINALNCGLMYENKVEKYFHTVLDKEPEKWSRAYFIFW